MYESRLFLPGEVRLDESRCANGNSLPTITGYAAVYFNRSDPAGTQFELADDVYERIAIGTFDEAIKRDDVRALFNHKPDFLIGRNTAGTLRLSTDSRGLKYEIDPPNSRIGEEVVDLIRRGDVSGSSFSFDIDRQHFSNEGSRTIRTLQSVRLMDVGPVTFPAYKGTTATLGTSAGNGKRVTPHVPNNRVAAFLAHVRRRASMVSRGI